MWSDYSFYGGYDCYDDGSVNRRGWSGELVSQMIIVIRMALYGYSSMIEREFTQVSRYLSLKHGVIVQPLNVSM